MNIFEFASKLSTGRIDMTNFTPGPWFISRDDRPNMEWNNHISSVELPHITICFMTHDGTKENIWAEANAHLIAAAPDMYEALFNLHRYHTDKEYRIKSEKDAEIATDGNVSQFEALADIARNVLAKARGES